MILDTPAFKALIKANCGLLFEGSSEEKLQHAITQRMEALCLSETEFLGRIQADESEFQELVNLLTINETYFFREPEQIALLVNRLAPRFLAASGGLAPIRILSAGCSSGEEPYSIAMALQGKYGESVSRLFSLVGADIDSAVLAKARQGRYTDFSFRGVRPEIRQRHFDQAPGGHVLKEDIRKLVSFQEMNLLAGSFPPGLQDFDIIFFRNVSIYFDTPTRKAIQHNLASLLKPDGILIIGSAETLANDLGVLRLVEEEGLFYFAKGSPPLLEQVIHPPHRPADTISTPAWNRPLSMDPTPAPMLPVLAPPEDWKRLTEAAATPAVPNSAPIAAPTPDLETLRQLVHAKSYDEALPALDQVLAGGGNHAEARLLKAHILIERKDFVGADGLAAEVLAEDPWSVDACILRGLAAKWSGRAEDAIRWFKQAVYGRHECWPAHYFLADLYRQGGALDLARRAYRVVIQLLSGPPPDTGIQHVPIHLPAGEIRFLCEHQLARLGGMKFQEGQV